MRSSASIRAWNCAALAASSRPRSSVSAVFSAWVYMRILPFYWEEIYNKKHVMQDIFVTYKSGLEPAFQKLPGRRQRALLVGSMAIKPLLRWSKQRAVDL